MQNLVDVFGFDPEERRTMPLCRFLDETDKLGIGRPRPSNGEIK
jgi:hypothetical protein